MRFPKRCANFGNEAKQTLFALSFLRLRYRRRVFGLAKQGREGDLHRDGKAVHRVEGKVASTAFDVGNVGAVQLRPICQLLLRQATTKTVEADGLAKAAFQVLRVSGGHADKVGPCLPV